METVDDKSGHDTLETMKLLFPGTRGYTESTSRRHRRHSACIVAYRHKRLLIDCGADWAGRIDDLSPHAILVTHAHPDHADGLRDGAPCPVYASAATLDRLVIPAGCEVWPLSARQPIVIRGITVETFPVAHSTRAPAVGFRVSAGRASVFYVPDVVYIDDRAAALTGVDLYVGDGSTVADDLVRKQGGYLIGHTPIRTQLTWCMKEGVERAVFTHCGEEIVAGDERRIGPKVKRMARERGVQARIAHDGMEITL